jgi:methyl-accepting chemotaxis protein
LAYVVVMKKDDKSAESEWPYTILTHLIRPLSAIQDPEEIMIKHRNILKERKDNYELIEGDNTFGFSQPVYRSMGSASDATTSPDSANTFTDESSKAAGGGQAKPGEDAISNEAQFLDDQGGAKNGSPGAAKIASKNLVERPVGYLFLGLSTKHLEEQKTWLARTLLLVFGIAQFGFTIFVFFAYKRLYRNLAIMLNAAHRIADGNLTESVPITSTDELGILATTLNHLSSNLNIMIRKIYKVTGSLNEVVDDITKSTGEIVQGAEYQVAAVDETSSSMAEMLASLKGIAENVEILASSAEESSSSIMEMAATNDEVADNINSLASSVEQTTSSIEEMTQAIKEVAKNVENLSTTTEETSTAMREIDASISQVETNANDTAALSEEVRRDAERGSEAVKSTIEGITRINESTQIAFGVIETLGKKVQAIGQVLNVIDDVAEQTNLLALNAAIIAAQAGEHGKGFAVVADEIKDLAERAATSTNEIANLVTGVQSETKNVINAMEKGLKSVDEGVGLSAQAEQALRKIVESSTRSTGMVRAIARATVEQSRGSKEVAEAIQRIAETVGQIAAATAEQAKGSEQIMSSAERMRVITQHVHASSQEQSRGSKQVTRAIENISEMVHHLNRAQKEQARGAEQVVQAVDRIKEVAEHHSSAMESMKKSVERVTEQAETLQVEMTRFKL